jgi:UDP-N-acetylmuramoyl-tripeptide--D-alanyl-D-alanine ligase
MIRLTLAEVAEAVGGQLIAENVEVSASLEVTGSVETDSRLLETGSLFFAKPGAVTDGHFFVGRAVESGAVASVVERYVDGAAGHPQIIVEDVVAALGKLAAAVLIKVRGAGRLKVIGVTGSNGKTTTKNLLNAILSRVGPTVAPIESYNNEVGAPISVLKIDFETRFLVAELGAGGVGSIRYLAELIQPDIGVLLKVGLAHVGEFGSIETTASIKGELLDVLAERAAAGHSNHVVANLDDSYVREQVGKHPNLKVTWFGTNADSDYRATGAEISLGSTTFDLSWPAVAGETARHQQPVNLQILGEHHVMNALASVAVGDLLGVPRAEIISAVEGIALAERWRMQVLKRNDGVTVINDAYNASPDSMKAALQTLAQLGRQGHRTIAVLGEMAELGVFSRTEHDAIGRLVVRYNIDQLVVVGQGARLIHMGASLEGSYDGESKFFESASEALDYLRGMLSEGDIVLVKSSKSANLRHLGDDLLEVSA